MTIKTVKFSPVKPWNNGIDVGAYPGSGKLVSEVWIISIVNFGLYYLLQAADVINVTNKNILVIGTQNPWVEAILLTKKPTKIVTLEYGQFKR